LSRLRRFALVAVCLSLVVWLAWRRREPVRPNLLLITLDTVRADRCSAYGHRRPTTPTLERLASEGVLFEQAYAPLPATLPSVSTMFTGQRPRSHGVERNGEVLPEAAVTLAERLAAAGYRTSAVVSSFVLTRRFGVAQGFEAFDDSFPGTRGELLAPQWEGFRVEGAFDQDSAVTSAEAVQALSALAAGPAPFFLWVHVFDPHWPYRPAPHFQFEPHERAPVAYDGEIREADAAVGAVLAELERSGAASTTLVAVVADHGEGLMQHGWMEHGLQVYEEAVRVPWVMRLPGRIAPGTRVQPPVELADLSPTLLALLRIPAAASPLAPRFEGRDLTSTLERGVGLPRDHPVFLQRMLYASSRVGDVEVKGGEFAVRRGSMKYIEARQEGRRELFDLETDPRETRNLAEARSLEADQLAALLRSWADEPRGTTALRPETPDSDVREGLRALGYVE